MKPEDLLVKILDDKWPIALVILAYAVSQARRVTTDTMNRMDKSGNESDSRRADSQKVLFNFYIVFATVTIFLAQYLGLIGNVLFVGLLSALLAALGIKVATDVLETRGPASQKKTDDKEPGPPKGPKTEQTRVETRKWEESINVKEEKTTAAEASPSPPSKEQAVEKGPSQEALKTEVGAKNLGNTNVQSTG